MGEEFELSETEWSGDNNTNGSGEKRDFPMIPDSTILEAEIQSVKKDTKPWKDANGNPVVKVAWAFKVVDSEYTGRYVWGDTPTTFTTHPECKLRAWVAEALGVNELSSGFRFNTDAVVGARVRVVVKVDTWDDKKTGEPWSRNNVSDIFRSRANEQSMASVSPAAEDNSEEPF